MKHENKGLYSGTQALIDLSRAETSGRTRLVISRLSWLVLLLALVVGFALQATPPVPVPGAAGPNTLINPVTISLAAIGASMEAVSSVNDACTRIPELNATVEAASAICRQYSENSRAMKRRFPNYICGKSVPAWRILGSLAVACLRAAFNLADSCKGPNVGLCGQIVSGTPIRFFYNPIVNETNTALTSCRTARDGFIQTVNAAVTGAQQQLAVGCVLDPDYRGEGDAHAARQISTDGGDTRTH